MNGWHTIKEVRLDLPAATLLAKEGKKAAARDCMKHARNLLIEYCEDERHPEHGFENEEIGS